MIKKHKKPLNQTPSSFLVGAIKKYYPEVTSNPILDLPCGFGRHSLYLVGEGHKVVCADYDSDVFHDRWFECADDLTPMLLDANKEFPFKTETFGLIVVVHFYADNLFSKLRSILRIGGIVIFESVSGCGGNWVDLPAKGEVKDQLGNKFDCLIYKETLAGPMKENVTLKMVARRVV